MEYHATTPKSVNYLFYTSPTTTSSSSSSGNIPGSRTNGSSGSSSGSSFATSGSAACANENAWSHTWDDGVITTKATEDTDGVITYTCSACNATEGQTYHYASEATDESEDTDDEDDETTVYTATFDTDSGVSRIDVYYTQDYTAADETGATTTYARDSDTGEIDVSGNGQINFLVVPEDGYSVSGIDISGTYKNLKGPSDTGVENMYRITKIESDLTVTVATEYTGNDSSGDTGDGDSSDTTDAVISAVDDDGTLGYFVDGVLQTDVTGAVEVSGVWYYVVNGIVSTTYNGFVKCGSDWYYFVDRSVYTKGYNMIRASKGPCPV